MGMVSEILGAVIRAVPKSERRIVEVNVDTRATANALERSKKQQNPEKPLVMHCLRAAGRIFEGLALVLEALCIERVARSRNLHLDASSMIADMAAVMKPI